MRPARGCASGQTTQSDDMNAIHAQPTRWLRRCAGACLWIGIAAFAALVLLALFVLASEPAHATADLRMLLATPLNVVRLVLLTACLALWGYIVHATRGAGRRVRQGEHA
jgi:hypothetical protein